MKKILAVFLLSCSASFAISNFNYYWTISLTGDTATVVKWKNNNDSVKVWAGVACDTLNYAIPRWNSFSNHDSTFKWMNIDTIKGPVNIDSIIKVKYLGGNPLFDSAQIRQSYIGKLSIPFAVKSTDLLTSIVDDSSLTPLFYANDSVFFKSSATTGHTLYETVYKVLSNSTVNDLRSYYESNMQNSDGSMAVTLLDTGVFYINALGAIYTFDSVGVTTTRAATSSIVHKIFSKGSISSSSACSTNAIYKLHRMQYSPEPDIVTWNPTLAVSGGTKPDYVTTSAYYKRVGNFIHCTLLLTGDSGNEGNGSNALTVTTPTNISTNWLYMGNGIYKNNATFGGLMVQRNGTNTISFLINSTGATLSGSDQNNTARYIVASFSYEATN
jgi:hypothetical protein